MHTFITGISTNVGKTVVSAILTQAWQADYWKPVQAGDLEHTDTQKVAAWVQNPKTRIHPETYRLNTPASPHYAAAMDKIQMRLADFQPPQTSNRLVIEGAGGLFVPLNDQAFIIDLIQHLEAQAVLVVGDYLGGINHTLLSVQALQMRQIPILGLVFNGDVPPASRDFILAYTQLACLADIPKTNQISPEWISAQAEKILS
jgi:dethiobiotin synthetase